MNEQKVVQEILYMLYLFQKENGTMLKARPKPEEMNHREIMVLQAICRMHPDGTPVKMSDLSAFFQVTPAAVSQTIRAFERKEWVERVRPEHDRRTVYIRVSERRVRICRNAWIRCRAICSRSSHSWERRMPPPWCAS